MNRLLLLAEIVFSSTFLTGIVILLVLQKDVRRLLIICLGWLLWLSCSVLVFVCRLSMGCYECLRISCDLCAFAILSTICRSLSRLPFGRQPTAEETLELSLENSQDYDEWLRHAAALDAMRGANIWREDPTSDLYDFDIVKRHVDALRLARMSGDVGQVMFLLKLCCRRDFGGIANARLYSVPLAGTKNLISEFQAEVCAALRWLTVQAALLVQDEEPEQSASVDSFQQSTVASESLRCNETTKKLAKRGSAKNVMRRFKRLKALAINSTTTTAAVPVCQSPTQQPCALQRSISVPHALQAAAATVAPGGSKRLSSQSEADLRSLDDSSCTCPCSCTLCQLPTSPLLVQLRTMRPSPWGASAQEVTNLLFNLRLSFGRTALCLSGGGSLAMYHMGVVKVLMERRALPRVISGTSGGSIVAGMLAVYTDEELVTHDIVKPSIVDRYGQRWFPPLNQQLRRFLRRAAPTSEVSHLVKHSNAPGGSYQSRLLQKDVAMGRLSF